MVCLKRYFIRPCTAVGTRPWTNRFMSANTTIVNSSSQSHMVDPDWIHILRKQCLPCVKGKVNVYVTCQCSENRCFWRVIDHKYLGPCCEAWCTVLTASYTLQHITLSTAYNLIMYPINYFLGLCRHFTHFLCDNKAVHKKTNNTFKVLNKERHFM